jgi:tetratricopeptide (TPR) repeat protein
MNASRASCLLLAVLLAGCAVPRLRHSEPVRVSEEVDVGDPARRASLRLVLAGLDADVDGNLQRALGSYERAIQVDPTNPFAYLAIARHHAESHDPTWALSFLDKAEALFRAQGGISPRVAPLLLGLRGQALYASGDIDAGANLLQRAWERAPDVWEDGRLSADELR